MNIGIIGAGNIGGVLATSLTRLGHAVKIANSRGPDTLGDLAKETGARAVTVQEAVHGVDLVVVTIPQQNVTKLPKGLFANVPASVPVVDTGNYYPGLRDATIAEIEGGMTESAWVSKQLGHTVVKAFNSISAFSLAQGGLPAGSKDRIALPIAADDERAKALVMELVEALGFDAVDAGSLDESWRQQPGTAVYATDRGAARVKSALASADLARSIERRDAASKEIAKFTKDTTPAEVVAGARRLFE